MENRKNIESGVWTVTETTYLTSLVIGSGAVLAAPEGKCLTMSVNGVGANIEPGAYEGNVMLTVTEPIPVAFGMNSYNYRAGVYIEGSEYIPEKSVSAVVKGDAVGSGAAINIAVTSNEDMFNGIYTAGDGEYLLENVEINLTGDGGNDFCGYGAALMAGENSKLTVNNALVNTHGVVRGAVFLGGNSVSVIKNSTFNAKGGKLPDDYKDSIMAGEMKCVPWMLGLRGNCRTTNLSDYATAHYCNCRFTSDGWGVVSTDGVKRCRLNVKDSSIEVTGESGYGAYSIGDCIDTFDHCTFKVPDYGMIISNGEASGAFTNRCVVDSGRFGIMFFNNKSGILTIDKDCSFNTGKSTFIIKGCTPEIKVDGSKLNCKNGRILELINSDDPGSTTGHYIDPIVEDIKDSKIDITKAKKGSAAFASFSNMDIVGSFFNATTNVKGDTGSGEIPLGGPGDLMDHGGLGSPGGEPMFVGVPGDENDPHRPGGPRDGGQGGVGAINLALEFDNVSLCGVISSSVARHRVKVVNKDNCEELGEVDHTSCPAVNNGVIVTLSSKTVWTVAGTSYLTALTISDESEVRAPGGKKVSIYIDGIETEIKPGKYKGSIEISID